MKRGRRENKASVGTHSQRTFQEHPFFFFLEMGVLLGEREKQPGEATVGFYPL
jgi:hypothetical protein